MWIIKNNTVGILLIEDLGIELKHGETFDLDLLGRDKAESSIIVAILVNKGALEIVSKDSVLHDNIDLDSIIHKFGVELLEELSHKFDDISNNFLNQALNTIQIKQLSQDIVIEEDDFQDISTDEVQARLFKTQDILASNFENIGDKKSTDKRTDNIVEQLKQAKKNQGIEKE